MSFKPVPQDLFFSRRDSADPRLGDQVRAVTGDIPPPAATSGQANPQTAALGDRAIAILGYPDDEGIRLNGGRTGAAEAPGRIRRYLYKMTPSTLSREPAAQVVDLGDLDTRSVTAIGDRHEVAEARASAALEAGYRVLSLGGGHDYGYPDTAAFAAWCSRQPAASPLVINFDAHLDVRPLDRGLTSGTPFFRLLEAYPGIDFAEIGIQAHCNALTHRLWAEARGARVLNLEDVRASGENPSVFVTRRLESWLIRRRPAFISVDIDGFSNAFAPGCSQSWAAGFSAEEFFQLFQILLARLDVRGVGIYEVSPPLDQDDRTSKLAALIAHRFIYPL